MSSTDRQKRSKQRELFAADGQESLFTSAERDQLAAIGEQATDEDKAELQRLVEWARSTQP